MYCGIGYIDMKTYDKIFARNKRSEDWKEVYYLFTQRDGLFACVSSLEPQDHPHCVFLVTRRYSDMGSFYMKGHTPELLNTYYCKHCNHSKIEHEVVSVSDGVTDSMSRWGAGVPTTRRECSNCLRWDGPWVSADLVGDGW